MKKSKIEIGEDGSYKINGEECNPFYAAATDINEYADSGLLDKEAAEAENDIPWHLRLFCKLFGVK